MKGRGRRRAIPTASHVSHRAQHQGSTYMNSCKRPQRGESLDNLPGQDGLPFGQDVADVQAGPDVQANGQAGSSGHIDGLAMAGADVAKPDGNEREVLTHPERLILTHLVLQDSRSGQGRQFRFTPPFGSSWTSSTRESGSSRRSSRRSGNDASGGPKAPRSSARPGRSGSTR